MNPMHSIKQWKFPDPAPNIPICQISRVSERAIALMARNRDKPLLNTDFLRIYGAVEMVAGMEYHYENFVRLSMQWAAGQDELCFRHEAVAYLNRMGQFEKFARSAFAKQVIPQPNIPTISRLMVFRNKYTAHRSIDVPRPEDTSDSQVSHARSLSTLFGKLFTPRAGTPVIDWKVDPPTTIEDAQKQVWSSNHLTFQIFDMKTKKAINFCLELDHLDVMNEAAVILEALILHC
jgi:hypothetical protein